MQFIKKNIKKNKQNNKYEIFIKEILFDFSLAHSIWNDIFNR